MTAIIVLIVCSLIVAGGFLMAFLFSVKGGQYDDTYTPAIRMLFDESEMAAQQHSSRQLTNGAASDQKNYTDSNEIKLQTPHSQL